MATQKLSAIAPSPKRARLMHLARLFRSSGEQHRTYVGYNSAPSDADDCKIYGVRDAKSALSTLLNEASKGDVAFIQGRTGTLLLVDVDMLADVLHAQEQGERLTLGQALKDLPYQPPELEAILLEGHAPQFDHLEDILRS